MRVFTRLLFVVLVANFEFAGFRKQQQKRNTQLITVSLEMAVRRNPDQERTNRNAWIYLAI